jgi:hypothetical protein
MFGGDFLAGDVLPKIRQGNLVGGTFTMGNPD